MGHISNPISNRLGFTCFWSSSWCSFLKKNYSYLLSEDFCLEDFVFWFFFSGENKYFKNNEFLVNNFYIYRSFNRLILKFKILPLSLIGEDETSLHFFFKSLKENFMLKEKNKILRFFSKKKKKNLKFTILKNFFFSFFFKFSSNLNIFGLKINKKKNNKFSLYFFFYYILISLKKFLKKEKDLFFFFKFFRRNFRFNIKFLFKSKKFIKKDSFIKEKIFFNKLKKKFFLIKLNNYLNHLNNEKKKLKSDKLLEINNFRLKKENLEKKFYNVSKFFIRKKSFLNKYNIAFFFFNIFFFNFIFKRLLYFGNFVKKNLYLLGLKKKFFFLVLENENFFNIKASSLASFIRLQFIQGFSIFDFIGKFLRILRSNPFILNFKVIISGRFSKASRSKKKIYSKGSMNLNSFKTPLDYGMSHCVTKFGVCGVKIILQKDLNVKKSNIKFNKNYFSFENFNIII